MTLQDRLEIVLSFFVKHFYAGADWLAREFPAIAEIADFALIGILLTVAWIIRLISLAIATRSKGSLKILFLVIGHTIGFPVLILSIVFSWVRPINLSANTGNPINAPNYQQPSRTSLKSSNQDLYEGKVQLQHGGGQFTKRFYASSHHQAREVLEMEFGGSNVLSVNKVG